MVVAKCALRYLKRNPAQGLLMKSDSNLQLVACCDSDWGASPITRRSLTGYFVTPSGSPISWKTKKQTTASRSSAEAEYREMPAATSERIWIRSLHASLRVFVKLPMRLFCDNQATLHIAKNPIFHEKSKHIEIDCHFIWKRILFGELITNYLPSKYQIADIFTKALGKR